MLYIIRKVESLTEVLEECVIRQKGRVGVFHRKGDSNHGYILFIERNDFISKMDRKLLTIV